MQPSICSELEDSPFRLNNIWFCLLLSKKMTASEDCSFVKGHRKDIVNRLGSGYRQGCILGLGMYKLLHDNHRLVSPAIIMA